VKEKVLLTYASRSGSTAEIGDKIAEVLRLTGFAVDLLPVAEVNELEEYSAVILGSAVYYGRWRKEAVKFLKDQEGALMDKKVWFFSSGPAGEGDPVALLDGWTFPPLLGEIADRIQPQGTVVFHGVMERSKMNFIERWLLKKMEAPLGDFRDWDSITAWAERIAADLI
jgi:menaquinone-dependent protoporphyrinogen oxidase